MNQDFIITLAWPEGLCEPAGSWYDKFFTIKGKYRVGHSALALVNSKTRRIHYLDFGRYETPNGFGRVRDLETDPNLIIKHKAIINQKQITNIEEILLEIFNNKSSNGEGTLYSSVLSGISFAESFGYAKKAQERGLIPYGPFIINGTNCSRFVAKIIRKSNPSVFKKLRLIFPFCISPSPKRNISIINKNYYYVRENKCKKVNKSILKAYFSGIEINEQTK